MVIRAVAGRAESGGPLPPRGTRFQLRHIRISSLKHIFPRFFELSLIDSRASTREQAQLNLNPLDLRAKSAFQGCLEGVNRVISVFSSFHRLNITLISTPICPKIQSNSPGSTGLLEKYLPTCAGSTRCFDINQNMSRLTPVVQCTKIEMNRNLGQVQPDKFRGKVFI